MPVSDDEPDAEAVASYHSQRDEGPCARSPPVSEVVIHGGDEQRHRRARARPYDGLRGERGRHVAREGVDDVRVGGEVDRHHCAIAR